MLVDSHCHLDFFENLKPIVKKAVESNVKTMVSCSTNPLSIKKHLKIQRKFREVKVCLGLHPSDLLRMGEEEIKEALNLIKKNLSSCAAIGEVGLDFKHATSQKQKELQEEVFRAQIQIALENNLPLVVHSRFAEQRAMKVLEDEGAKRVLMHWFTNSLESVKTAQRLGFFMSCGPIILSSAKALEIAKKMPLGSLVLETDAPLAFLGKQSDPSWVSRVSGKASDSLGIKKEELAKKTTKNAFALFSLND